MKFITVSELRLMATQVITELESSKEDVVVTKKGKPVALIKFITEEIFSIKNEAKGSKKQ